MNLNTLKWLLATLIIASLGCNESEIPEPVSAAPSVRVLSPNSGDSAYQSGENVVLQVQFDDDIELHEMAVYIIRLHDGAMVYEQHLHQHGASYRWIDNPAMTTPVASDFEVRAIVTDHELQRTEVSEFFRVIP